MAHVERLRVYPVKALDAEEPERTRVGPAGRLAGDREYVLLDGDGAPIHGKATTRVHDLRTRFDPSSRELTVRVRPGADAPAGDHGPVTFHLDFDRAAAERWFSNVFDADVTVRRDERGFPDRGNAGPSVVSTATLEAAADWFDDVTVDGLRRRLRANVEVGGVDPFWEDRFVGPDAPAFAVDGPDGPVRFEGVEPCGRCVVPTRDPDTGEATPDFRERFVEGRAGSYPEEVDADAFPHDYTLMLIADVPERHRGRTVAVGDDVRVLDD